MSNERVITDRRLLAALDYIDQKYIDDVFSIIKEPDIAVEYVPGKKSPFKYWKQFVALAACVVLLSVAAPLAGYISQVISNFRAGAGSGTTEEMSDVITDENGIPYTYPMFVDDLEPLTADEMLAIDELWVKKAYERIYDSTYKEYLKSGYSELDAHARADKIATREINALDKHRFFNELYYEDSRYYGKINDCVILVSVGMAAVTSTYEIAGYTISFSNVAEIDVVKDGELLRLKEAYDLGYLTDDNIGLISERNDAYNLYLDSYLKEMQSRKEN